MSFFKFFSITLLLSLFSYSNVENKKIPEQIALNNIPQSTNVNLLKHQMIPIDYMQKNPEQKGILINHYMGTGKTLLGIAFAENYQDNPVIILAPKFLQRQWENELTKFGVKNKNRYQFISYDNAINKSLAYMDLKKHIIIADEVHNIVKNMQTYNQTYNLQYSNIYINLKNAHKFIGLSGTPIFNDESDIAYLINLVSQKDLMPTNKETFRLSYTEIIPSRQFFRGYFTENNFFNNIVMPNSLAFFGVSSILTYTQDPALLGVGLLGGALFSVFLPISINYFLNLNSYKLRQLNPRIMAPMFQEYISYFKFDENSFKEFPKMTYKVQEVDYSKEQYSFFLHMVEGDLPVNQLQRLLKNDPIKLSNEQVKLNSTNIHAQINNIVGSGRDIGNFEFTDKTGQITESPKFIKVLQQIRKDNDQTVVYSNYYHTGILAFMDFLKRQNYNEKFALLEPNMSAEYINSIVEKYNNQEIKLILLHPDITEGISLKGTQHFHILEPMLNGTTEEQVIGRARRFQSHSHLPKDKQVVHVTMWKASNGGWEVAEINRANWYKRYRELNYLSRWGIGMSQIDPNYNKKALNPDDIALLKLKTLNKNFEAIQQVLSKFSIENKY